MSLPLNAQLHRDRVVVAGAAVAPRALVVGPAEAVGPAAEGQLLDDRRRAVDVRPPLAVEQPRREADVVEDVRLALELERPFLPVEGRDGVEEEWLGRLLVEGLVEVARGVEDLRDGVLL